VVVQGPSISWLVGCHAVHCRSVRVRALVAEPVARRASAAGNSGRAVRRLIMAAHAPRPLHLRHIVQTRTCAMQCCCLKCCMQASPMPFQLCRG